MIGREGNESHCLLPGLIPIRKGCVYKRPDWCGTVEILYG